MIRMLLSFILMFGVLYFGIEMFRNMTGKEKWDTAKTTIYSVSIALLTAVIMTVIVVLF